MRANCFSSLTPPPLTKRNVAPGSICGMHSAKEAERLQFRYSAGEQTSLRSASISRQKIAQILPSAGIEVGQKDAKECSMTPTTQIADEALTCWLSMK